MKIVHLITALQLGGAEKVAIDISKNMETANFEVFLISIFKDQSDFSKELKKDLLKHKIKWKEFGLNKDHRIIKYIGMILSIFQIFVFILKLKPDVVHSHTDLPDFVLASVLRMLSVFSIQPPKIVRTIHNTKLWPSRPKLGKFVEKAFKNDHVVFISIAAKNAYKQLRIQSGIPQTVNSYFISNGVDLEKYTGYCDLKALKKHHVNLNPNKVNLLFVGRLTEQKGFDLIFDAFHLLQPSYLNQLHLHVFGTGEQVSLLSKDYNSDLPITLYPPTSELELLYGCFDFLLMPSRYEGLPLVCLEALSSKLPVIGTNAPGLYEALPKGWPLISENGSAESIGGIINQIVGKKHNHTLLVESSLNFIESNFSLKKTVKQYNELYNNI
ncbi:glycosyltransferase family 4 protein [Aliiglaciecola lipolytica]|uniref:glycosyltransferase family 4 protein n=1 Tax=Aliiglaciecola lipolytica TaxID=477689 RepID=UPI001C09E588|nr:glycosyltransferase family 4 protein [Aliiglaciecola lipolytica]MBU2880304.1 glycosyltransferase family 4 protein [Aliiglaciecola lipolytica]